MYQRRQLTIIAHTYSRGHTLADKSRCCVEFIIRTRCCSRAIDTGALQGRSPLLIDSVESASSCSSCLLECYALEGIRFPRDSTRKENSRDSRQQENWCTNRVFFIRKMEVTRKRGRGEGRMFLQKLFEVCLIFYIIIYILYFWGEGQVEFLFKSNRIALDCSNRFIWEFCMKEPFSLLYAGDIFISILQSLSVVVLHQITKLKREYLPNHR